MEAPSERIEGPATKSLSLGRTAVDSRREGPETLSPRSLSWGVEASANPVLPTLRIPGSGDGSVRDNR